MVEEVEGYPYFIQLWGSELWDAADLAGVEAGVLYRIRKGEYGYTAPRFRDFLLRRATA